MSDSINPFKQIATRELHCLFRTCYDANDGDKQKTVDDLELIDRSLRIMKSRCMLMKRSPTIKQQIDALLHASVTGKQPIWDGRSRKYRFN